MIGASFGAGTGTSRMLAHPSPAFPKYIGIDEERFAVSGCCKTGLTSRLGLSNPRQELQHPCSIVPTRVAYGREAPPNATPLDIELQLARRKISHSMSDLESGRGSAFRVRKSAEAIIYCERYARRMSRRIDCTPSPPPPVDFGKCDRRPHTLQSVGGHQIEWIKSLRIDCLTG